MSSTTTQQRCPTPRKRRFRSETRALNWNREQMRRTPVSPLHAYKCPCGFWHLTLRGPR